MLVVNNKNATYYKAQSINKGENYYKHNIHPYVLKFKYATYVYYTYHSMHSLGYLCYYRSQIVSNSLNTHY